MQRRSAHAAASMLMTAVTNITNSSKNYSIFNIVFPFLAAEEYSKNDLQQK
jgi:hypothetical protein